MRTFLPSLTHQRRQVWTAHLQLRNKRAASNAEIKNSLGSRFTCGGDWDDFHWHAKSGKERGLIVLGVAVSSVFTPGQSEEGHSSPFVWPFYWSQGTLVILKQSKLWKGKFFLFHFVLFSCLPEKGTLNCKQWEEEARGVQLPQRAQPALPTPQLKSSSFSKFPQHPGHSLESFPAPVCPSQPTAPTGPLGSPKACCVIGTRHTGSFYQFQILHFNSSDTLQECSLSKWRISSCSWWTDSI